jgi:hypothetical protein
MADIFNAIVEELLPPQLHLKYLPFTSHNHSHRQTDMSHNGLSPYSSQFLVITEAWYKSSEGEQVGIVTRHSFHGAMLVSFSVSRL